MSQPLLILGAGADRTAGIDFPLANTLLADVTQYLSGPGKPVDAALRAMLPGLKFSFNNMIARAVDKITAREPYEQRAMVERVQHAIASLPPEKDAVRKHGDLIIKLFNKLAIIAEESQLDEETEALIREVFPKDADELIDSESILDIRKLSLSDTFKTVLKRTLRMGLSSDNNEVAAALGADMLNVEALLIEKFLGFYNEKLPDIKNYLYISWALWAFLVSRQQQVLAAHTDKSLPFYGNLPTGLRAITLNYTSFLQQQVGAEQTIHFHGGLADYVRMDTRDLLAIENVLTLDPVEFIQQVIAPNVDFSHEDMRLHKHVIPAMVPPLRLKPILSHRYIELWGQASRWVEEAERIVVVGYSFNSADEHFNDILRNHDGKRIDIVSPGAISEQSLHRMEKIFGTAANQYNVCMIQGRSCRKAKKIRLIPARADEINLVELFANPT